ncbi:MAG: SH3 domain-containing protein [Lachnospiraceae bacterium]|nr:SH3 domain-containing protein [Lachnospiraceae bacterium]
MRIKTSGVFKAIMPLIFATVAALFVCFTSLATSQCKVTADSVKIRSEASTSSSALGSAKRNDELTIKAQTTGSDGMVWYQVFVDADTLGFVRSDLVSITDGTTPSTISNPSSGSTQEPTQTTTETPAAETPVEVNVSADFEKVNPVSGTVKGSNSIRVRNLPSTSSSIVATASKGLVVTVEGRTSGSDGYEWYRVNYSANNDTVEGFIRSDYVDLSEELSPFVEEVVEEEPVEVEEEPVQVEKKAWETANDEDTWYIIDNNAGQRYKIADLFDAAESNAALYQNAQQEIKKQKLIIILMLIFLLVLLGGISALVFKLREVKEDEEIAAAERANARRRAAQRANAGQMQRRPEGENRRPEGENRRPVDRGAERPRPQRPEGRGPRPQSNEGGTVQANNQVRRPLQKRPEGAAAPVRGEQARANAPRPEKARPAQPERKVKNFMEENDEFDFDFLNSFENNDEE